MEKGKTAIPPEELLELSSDEIKHVFYFLLGYFGDNQEFMEVVNSRIDMIKVKEQYADDDGVIYE
jgi:hypothetical protein